MSTHLRSIGNLNIAYWSLHAYPHSVTAHGISRYMSISSFTNSFPLKLSSMSNAEVPISNGILTRGRRSRSGAQSPPLFRVCAKLSYPSMSSSQSANTSQSSDGLSSHADQPSLSPRALDSPVTQPAIPGGRLPMMVIKISTQGRQQASATEVEQ